MTAETAVAEMPRWKEALIGARERFIAIASTEQMVEWQRESMFALQALEKNDYLRDIAEGNPTSLRNAIINVAACGITLNPVSQYAALVPRDGAVCLDIMYRGFLKIATDAGSIRWGRAELVFPGDEFTYNGPAQAPEHRAQPFVGERGDPIGVYCIAKTVDGDVLCDVMPAAEVLAIRDRSPAWMKKKKGPWQTDPGEMWKKTVIKRARKTWPESTNKDAAHRLQIASEVSNEADGHLAITKREDSYIGPQSGAEEALTTEIKEELIECAAKVEEAFRKVGAGPAYEYLASLNLDADQYIYAWGRLESPTRTAIRKAEIESRVGVAA